MTRTSTRFWIVISAVLLIGLVTYVYLYPPTAKKATTVATVNGVNISSDQLYQAMLTGGGKQTLDGMITEELVSQEGKKAGVTVTDQDLDNEIATLKKTFPSETEFESALTSYGMTLDQLKTQMKTQVELKKILSPTITISDDDVQKYYNDNLQTLKQPEQVKASHIVVATKEEADAVLADLKKGADFAETAKTKSIDDSTKASGGDLSYFSRGSGDPAVENAAFALQPGGLSEPIKTDAGYEIIKVTDHKAASTPTLDEKKQEIRDHLLNDKVASMSQTWLDQKKSEAKIENFLEKA